MRTCNEYRRIKIEDKSTHSSRIRMTSVLFSKTSWSVMMLGCWISFRMFTSRSMSSLVTPRRLDLLRRFLMNLAAYSTPVLLCRHLLTTANWPLMRGGEKEIVKRCIKNSNYSFDITTLILNYSWINKIINKTVKKSWLTLIFTMISNKETRCNIYRNQKLRTILSVQHKLTI